MLTEKKKKCNKKIPTQHAMISHEEQTKYIFASPPERNAQNKQILHHVITHAFVWFRIEFADWVIPSLIFPISALANPSFGSSSCISRQLCLHLRTSQLSLFVLPFTDNNINANSFICGTTFPPCSDKTTIKISLFSVEANLWEATLFLGIKFKNNFNLKRFLFIHSSPPPLLSATEFKFEN